MTNIVDMMDAESYDVEAVEVLLQILNKVF